MENYRFLLLQISEELSQRDLKNLVFYCEDCIQESAVERISCGIDLFRLLRHQDQLGPGKYGYLRKGLMAIGRVDLARKLPSNLKSVLSQVPLRERSSICLCEFPTPANPTLSSRQRTFAVGSPRAQLLQIAERLNSEDVSRLAYLFANKLPQDTIDKVSAFQLLRQLESSGIIDPDNLESLTSCLHVIGRKDLASLLVSMQTPQCVWEGLGHSQQLLNIKFSMLAETQARYSFQRKLMLTIVSSEYDVFEEQVVKPSMWRLLKSYDYSVVCDLSVASLGEPRRQWDLSGLIESTLPLTFDLMEAYMSAIYHYLSCEDGVIKIDIIQPFFQTCRNCYEKFEKLIGEFQWNIAFRRDIQKDLVQRRTAIGSPAHMAASCIYEISRELSGKESTEAALETADMSIHALEWLHYSYCYRIIMTQWLETLLCFVTDGTIADSISYDHSTLHETLLQIASKSQRQISSVYNKLASVVGEEMTARVADELHSKGVHIDSQIGVSFQHAKLGTDDSAVYVMNMSASMYTYLLLLLQFSFFGGEGLELRSTLLRLRSFHCDFMSSEMYIPSTFQLYRNLVSAYELQIETFKDQVLKSDALCAPALRHLTSLQTM